MCEQSWNLDLLLPHLTHELLFFLVLCGPDHSICTCDTWTAEQCLSVCYIWQNKILIQWWQRPHTSDATSAVSLQSQMWCCRPQIILFTQIFYCRAGTTSYYSYCPWDIEQDLLFVHQKKVHSCRPLRAADLFALAATFSWLFGCCFVFEVAKFLSQGKHRLWEREREQSHTESG